MIIFTVLARRYGSQETHCYHVGTFDTYEQAEKAAISEESYRGCKYDCEIVRSTLNVPSDNVYDVVRKCPKKVPTLPVGFTND
jgi:hypothetical protein